MANVDRSDLAAYMADVTGHRLLTPAEERSLFEERDRARRDIERGRSGAQEQLRKITTEIVSRNLRLVVRVANGYRTRGPLPDLIQEGNIGLLKAVERFDVAREMRFITYAVWWVRAAITRSVADRGRVVRLPVHLDEKAGRLRRAEAEFRSNYGREPHAEELGPMLGMPPKKIERLRVALASPVSLDAALPSGEGTLHDALADGAEPVDEAIADTERAGQARALLASLTPREVEVIRGRFWREETLLEVGEGLGVSRERVRQVETRALTRLRKAANFPEAFGIRDRTKGEEQNMADESTTTQSTTNGAPAARVMAKPGPKPTTEADTAALVRAVEDAKARLRDRASRLRHELGLAEAALRDDGAEERDDGDRDAKPDKPPAGRTERVLAYVRGHPGLTAAAVAQAVGESARVVSITLCRLRSRRLVASSGRAGELTWRAAR